MIIKAVAFVSKSNRVRPALDVVSSDPDHIVSVGACEEALGELNTALQLQSIVILQSSLWWRLSDKEKVRDIQTNRQTL